MQKQRGKPGRFHDRNSTNVCLCRQRVFGQTHCFKVLVQGDNLSLMITLCSEEISADTRSSQVCTLLLLPSLYSYHVLSAGVYSPAPSFSLQLPCTIGRCVLSWPFLLSTATMYYRQVCTLLALPSLYSYHVLSAGVYSPAPSFSLQLPCTIGRCVLSWPFPLSTATMYYRQVCTLLALPSLYSYHVLSAGVYSPAPSLSLQLPCTIGRCVLSCSFLLSTATMYYRQVCTLLALPSLYSYHVLSAGVYSPGPSLSLQLPCTIGRCVLSCSFLLSTATMYYRQVCTLLALPSLYSYHVLSAGVYSPGPSLSLQLPCTIGRCVLSCSFPLSTATMYYRQVCTLLLLPSLYSYHVLSAGVYSPGPSLSLQLPCTIGRCVLSCSFPLSTATMYYRQVCTLLLLPSLYSYHVLSAGVYSPGPSLSLQLPCTIGRCVLSCSFPLSTATMYYRQVCTLLALPSLYSYHVLSAGVYSPAPSLSLQLPCTIGRCVLSWPFPLSTATMYYRQVCTLLALPSLYSYHVLSAGVYSPGPSFSLQLPCTIGRCVLSWPFLLSTATMYYRQVCTLLLLPSLYSYHVLSAGVYSPGPSLSLQLPCTIGRCVLSWPFLLSTATMYYRQVCTLLALPSLYSYHVLSAGVYSPGPSLSLQLPCTIGRCVLSWPFPLSTATMYYRQVCTLLLLPSLYSYHVLSAGVYSPGPSFSLQLPCTIGRCVLSCSFPLSTATMYYRQVCTLLALPSLYSYHVLSAGVYSPGPSFSLQLPCTIGRCVLSCSFPLSTATMNIPQPVCELALILDARYLRVTIPVPAVVKAQEVFNNTTYKFCYIRLFQGGSWW